MSDYIEQMAREVWLEAPETRVEFERAITEAFQSLWIDIAEHGPPEEEKPVWFCEEDGTIHRGSYEGDRAWWDEDELELISANVTHYMPVFTPPPPKRNERNTPNL